MESLDEARNAFKRVANALRNATADRQDALAAAIAMIEHMSRDRQAWAALAPQARLAVRIGMQEVPPIGTKKKHPKMPSEIFTYDKLRELRNILAKPIESETVRLHAASLLDAISDQLSPEAMQAAAEKFAVPV